MARVIQNISLNLKRIGDFKKDDLLSNQIDPIHQKKYVDSENIIREFSVDKLRYLEWETDRVPTKISRVTIPETDADIQRIFTEQENLKNEIQQKIENVRQTYKELDEMVIKLYENISSS